MSDEPLVASSTVEEQAPPPEKLTGISVYPGIAYGLCQQFSAGDLEIPQFVIEKTGTRGEIQRLRAAIATVDKQLGALIDSADEDMPAEAAAFIDVHRTILRDPTLIEETDKIMNAQKARGAQLDTGKMTDRVKALVPVLIPLFISAFRRADELAMAMECRCYRGGDGRTRLKVLRCTRQDYIDLAVCIVCFALILSSRLVFPNF